jgi:Rnl2 family RNA ligase
MNTSPFNIYSDIEGTYHENFLKEIKEQKLDYGTWIVNEKVHGCNFSFTVTNEQVIPAKRHSYLKNENFHNYKKVLDKYKIKCQKIYELLRKKYDSKPIIIYGELYGGGYPGIPTDDDEKMVQKGIYYSPNIDFIAFDIYTNSAYIDYTEFMNVMKKTKMPYLEPLFIGNYDDAIKYNERFQTTIPELFNLPYIKDNFAEGVVIKPIEQRYILLKKHATPSRIILKKKRKEFLETNPTFTQEKKDKSKKHEIIITKYINENRLTNVMSKMEKITREKYGHLIGMMTNDVMKDLIKLDVEYYDKLDKDDKYLLRKEIGQLCCDFIYENLKEIK